MTDLRELLARAIYASAWWVSNPAGFEGITSGMREDIFREVNAIIAALKENGLVVVPVEPTDEMVAPLTRVWLMSDQEPLEADLLEATGYLKSALYHGPFAKEFR